MTTFQLDECFNDKRLAEACIADGRCIVNRYPKRLKSAPDALMLPELLSKAGPLLTLDFNIVEHNILSIPPENAGIIVVRKEEPAPTITSSYAAKILARFKAAFPEWISTDWSNIHIQINEHYVYVAPLVPEEVPLGVFIGYERQNFADELRNAISAAKAGKNIFLDDPDSPSD